MTSPFLLGLTGSVGMGKSTTAAMFVDEGIPVWDADAAVHRLYAKGGEGARQIGKIRPQAIKEGAVDRAVLRDWIEQDAGALPQIEAIIHPLVAADRSKFIAETAQDLIVLDIPLLFETGAEATMDATLVVSAPPAVQKERVLARPGMTKQQFDLILSRQMPDAEKRRRATFVIETLTLEQTRQDVQNLIKEIRESHA